MLKLDRQDATDQSDPILVSGAHTDVIQISDIGH